MRGSRHDKNIREFTIDEQGMRIDKPFASVTGILSGSPIHINNNELQRLETIFEDEHKGA